MVIYNYSVLWSSSRYLNAINNKHIYKIGDTRFSAKIAVVSERAASTAFGKTHFLC